MNKPAKNIASSILNRLLNYSKEHQEEYQSLLTRYTAERFLYRLGESQYREAFILKGAYLLTLTLDKLDYRTTKDIDFLKTGATDTDSLNEAVREICLIPFPEDGLVFDTETIQFQDIREQNAYHGQRVKIQVHIGNARVTLQMDIGIGDTISPATLERTIPPILPMHSPTVITYPIETVIAEKLEAIISLGLLTSRMKDFFDLYVISRQMTLDYQGVVSALQKTFLKRGTALPQKRPIVFSKSVLADRQKEIQWTAFIRKLRKPEFHLSFEEVINQLCSFTDIFWTEAAAATPTQWVPSQGWQ